MTTRMSRVPGVARDPCAKEKGTERDILVRSQGENAEASEVLAVELLA